MVLSLTKHHLGFGQDNINEKLLHATICAGAETIADGFSFGGKSGEEVIDEIRRRTNEITKTTSAHQMQARAENLIADDENPTSPLPVVALSRRSPLVLYADLRCYRALT